MNSYNAFQSCAFKMLNMNCNTNEHFITFLNKVSMNVFACMQSINAWKTVEAILKINRKGAINTVQFVSWKLMMTKMKASVIFNHCLSQLKA